MLPMTVPTTMKVFPSNVRTRIFGWDRKTNHIPKSISWCRHKAGFKEKELSVMTTNREESCPS
jgi:hypothetical protein